MSAPLIRPMRDGDEGAIAALVTAAFGGDGEAKLVAALRESGDAVLELVAERDGKLIGHILFSRLRVEDEVGAAQAVALAPLAVLPTAQGGGVGSALVAGAHARLGEAGETLSVVLGEPAYYGRFGYCHARAAGFASDYQGEALQAAAWSEDAPARGRLIYAPPFAAL